MKSRPVTGWIRIFVPLVALAFAGCGVTDGGRGLNHQNKGAGTILKAHSDPAVASIGADVEANAAALEAEIGSPKEPKPYSSENSAAFRNAQEAQLQARAAWWEFINWAAGAAAGLAGLGGAWAWLSKLKLGKLFNTVAGAVESLPPDIAPKVKDAILKGNLKGGVSDLAYSLVKKVT